MRRLALPLGLLALLATACADHGSGEPLGEVSEATQVCPMTVVEGVDVYDGQGAIDWASVHADQRLFAFVKATQGNYNDQSTFAADWSGTKSAGVIRSPYHFFDPTIDGVAQAQYFLMVLNAQGGLQPGDLPPMLDIECPTASTQSAADPNCEYSGNSGWVDTATLSQRVFDWLRTVEQATGRKALIYSYPSWFADVGFTDARLAQYPLFIATYGACASVPAPWTTTVFWQYSSTGTVTGINGQVDVDRFLGSDAELVAFANGAAAADGGTEGGAGDAGPRDASGGGDGAVPGKDAATNGEGGPGRDGGGQADGGAGGDAAVPPGTGNDSNGGGCSCRAAGGTPGAAGAPGWGILVAAGALVRTRRRAVTSSSGRRASWWRC